MVAASLLSAVMLAGAFGPAVRIDREDRPGHACYHADIAVSPGPDPVIYCAFEDDSVPFTIVNSDIAFQRSTDLGRTWLSENVPVFRGNRFACYPDLKAGPDGSLLLVFTDRIDGSRGHIAFTRSLDSGRTWSPPVQVDDNTSRVAIGWARLALDSRGSLFCTWTDQRGQYLRVYSDVSTDQGRTWGTDVRVDDDTVSFNCYPPDCFVQPGTDDYLVTAVAPVRGASGIVLHSHFYRSTDRGRTFSTGFQLDTFRGYSQQPHVVADAEHVVTDYGGNGYGNQCVTMARTWFARGDTWGRQVMVTELDTIYSSYTNGARLAIDPQSKVHTGLMIADRATTIWNIYYTGSTDAGVSWSEREAVSSLPLVQQWDPTVAADAAGNVYLAWQDMRENKAEIWFATNNAAAARAEEGTARRPAHPALTVSPSICRSRTVLRIPGQTKSQSALTVLLFDAAGRLIRRFVREPGSPSVLLDLRSLPGGVYLVRLANGSETAEARIVRLPD